MERKAQKLLKNAAVCAVSAGTRAASKARCELEVDARRHQQQLQELAEHLVHEEELARGRIARYLHDTVAQNLSLANLRLGPIVKCLSEVSRPEEAGKLGEVRALLVQAMEECRQAMAELTPPLLYELGVMPALYELGRRLEVKHAVRIVVASDGVEGLVRPALRGLLFQAVRELVLNALRHAQPQVVKVTAAWGAREVRMTVADDGCGFAAEHHGGGEAPACLGLFGIRQRLAGVSGRLEIASVPGAGATVTLHVPVLAPSGAGAVVI